MIWGFRWGLVALGCFLLAGPSSAQGSLHLVNTETQVYDLQFRGHQTFDTEQLQAQIFTRAPSAGQRFLNRLAFWSDPKYPFSPVELQKDVVRLRRFYQRNGFLQPNIDYIARLDTAHNQIRIRFQIVEGPPLMVDAITFVHENAPIDDSFLGTLNPEWQRFIRNLILRTGRRFTNVATLQTQEQILTWLRNRGYAFADVGLQTMPDPDRHRVAVQFAVAPGPRGRVTEIQIEGPTQVDTTLVLRALPFERGDLYAENKLRDGQRALFGLNLFRIALAEVPEQPVDETVTVRIRLREAKLRYLSAQPGYALDQGLTLQAQWQHRNFAGGGRNLTFNGDWATTIGALENTSDGVDAIEPRLYLGASVQQPYLFHPSLSAFLSPFYENNSTDNRESFGISTRLVYNFYTFRAIEGQYEFRRNRPIDESVAQVADSSFYTTSTLSLSGTFGRANDYINPTRGVLFRPLIAFAGGLIYSDVEYIKVSAETSVYTPLTRRIGLAARLAVGRIFPRGASADQEDPDTINRFLPIRFFAGGSNDVRGWGYRQLGPVRTENNAAVPKGGLAEIRGSVEFRLPAPGLPPAWRTALFLDFGQIQETGPSFNPRDLLYAFGGGIRYRTPVGFLRFDLAYKLQDLTSPLERRRWTYHLSISRAF